MTVYLGIDWSEQKHDVCWMNEAGAAIQYQTIPHNEDGFFQLEQARQTLGVAPQDVQIGLETAHTLLIDFLLDQSYPAIYVLPPSQVNDNLGRFAQSGAKDDYRAAWVIADMLRTDRGRYHPWHPDSLLTRQLQVQVRQVIYLTRMIRRQANRLRAVLLRYYPGAVAVFARIDSPITLALVQAYPTPAQAAQLSYADFECFLREHHHSQRAKWLACYQRLTEPGLQARPETVELYADQAQVLARQLAGFVADKSKAMVRLQALFVQHQDAGLFSALPGVGDFLAPALLAKLGDDRERYPCREMLQAIAGTCPITHQSGRHRSVVFRQACDREFRYVVSLWAREVGKNSGWAKAYLEQLHHRRISEADAYRRLGNRLLAILWKLWQDKLIYQESVHLQQRLARAKPRQEN